MLWLFQRLLAAFGTPRSDTHRRTPDGAWGNHFRVITTIVAVLAK
ncbi:hypothetical protein [Lyngbya aestuarii]